MLDLWLIRHAESVGNIDGTASDSDLTAKGRAQAVALREHLKEMVFDKVYSSPLIRARETAAIALPGVPVLVDPRLTELETGPQCQVVDLADPEAFGRLLRSAPPLPRESGKAFMARVRAWRAELPICGSVLAFTHVAVVRELIADLLGFRRAPSQVDHASIFRFEILEDGVGVKRWNSAERSRISSGEES